MFKKLKKMHSSVKTSVKSRFDKSFKGLTMCKKCYAFYYQRVWHFEAPGYIRDEGEQDLPVHLTQCPACIELEVTLFERDVVTS